MHVRRALNLCSRVVPLSIVCILIPSTSSQRCRLYRKPFTNAIMLGRGNKGPMGPSLHSTRWMISFISHYDYVLLQSQQLRTLSSLHSAQRGFSPPPLPSSHRKQQIFLIFSFFFFFFSGLPFLSASKWLKFCLPLPQRNTMVEAAAAEPGSWRPLLHVDELSTGRIHDNATSPHWVELWFLASSLRTKRNRLQKRTSLASFISLGLCCLYVRNLIGKDQNATVM